MFGSLKKKLKEVLEKTKAPQAIKEEPQPVNKQEENPQRVEEIREQPQLTEEIEEHFEVTASQVTEETRKEEQTESQAEAPEEEPPKEFIAEKEIIEKTEELRVEPEQPHDKRPGFFSSLRKKKPPETKEPVAPAAPVAVQQREVVEEGAKHDELVTEIKEEEPLFEEEKFSLFKRITEKKLDDEGIEKILKELRVALLENDVALEVADKITADVKSELTGSSVKRGKTEDVIKAALKKSMLGVMKQDKIDIEELIEAKEGPFTIMMVGFNGVGKTTTLAKLANRLKKYKPILAAADTFRAASIEQLEEHGKNLQLRVVKHDYGADAAAVIFDAKKHAAAAGSKLVLADTAGRSHNNVNLMDELTKVARVNKPDLKILVLDSITGNDIYDQCKLFNEAVGVDAIILTKADVYERGGSALSAAYTLKKPILFLGTGQEYSDLKEFNPEEIVKNLLE